MLCETYHKLPEELDECDLQRLLINVDLLGTYRMVQKMNPERFERLAQQAQREAGEQFRLYQQLATINPTEPEPQTNGEENAPEPAKVQ